MSAACGSSSPGGADAALDAAPLAGDYSCAGMALPTTAPDPLQVNGQAIDQTLRAIPGANIEIRASADDAVLGQTTAGSSPVDRGVYHVNITTGGVAPQLVRHLSAASYVDSYAYDGRPATTAPNQTWMHTASQLDMYYQLAGATRDPALGTLELDIYDCAHKFVAGATIDAPGAQVIYLDSSLAPNPAQTAQSPSGGVLILNAPPGPADITVFAGPVVYRSWPVQVRAGALVISDRLP